MSPNQLDSGSSIGREHRKVKNLTAPRPVIFGEVLFDIFPDGTKVPGGAPFNVAWGLKGLGLDPLFISRVGDDETGHEILESMRGFGLETAGVQIDDNLPTGRVSVEIKNGQPAYTIEADQAYDNIDAQEAMSAIGTDNFMLYHGTLAVRNRKSKEALSELRKRAQMLVIDVNLRKPWFESADVTELIRNADIVKLNDEELFTLTGSCPMKGDDLTDLAHFFRDAVKVRKLIVTKGSDGALLSSDGKSYEAKPKTAGQIIDTVGAGDAFSAGFIAAMAEGVDEQEMLTRGVKLASAICTIRGATSRDPGVYRSAMR